MCEATPTELRVEQDVIGHYCLRATYQTERTVARAFDEFDAALICALWNKAIDDRAAAHRVGDLVEKVGGDYTFIGVVVASFRKKTGARRYVVEDDRGVLHVYSANSLRQRSDTGV